MNFQGKRGINPTGNSSSNTANFHDGTGGVYKDWGTIHRDIIVHDY